MCSPQHSVCSLRPPCVGRTFNFASFLWMHTLTCSTRLLSAVGRGKRTGSENGATSSTNTTPCQCTSTRAGVSSNDTSCCSPCRRAFLVFCYASRQHIIWRPVRYSRVLSSRAYCVLSIIDGTVNIPFARQRGSESDSYQRVYKASTTLI